MKFRKKPVVVDAVQYLPHENCRVVSDFLGQEYNPKACENGPIFPEFVINTLEGEMTASPGDWIIRGVNGEIYPCKPDVFEKTYEALLKGER